MKKGIIKAISLILCMVFLLDVTGCQNPINKEKAEESLELVDVPMTTLDNVWYNPGGIFRCAVFESLLLTNADMTEIKESLAQEYMVSEDRKSYVFILRKDVKWHDGEIFDAEDVVFSIKAALRSEEINGIFTSAFQYIEGADDYSQAKRDEISGVSVDGREITVRLTQPVGDFLDIMAQFAILPEHLLGDIDPKYMAEDVYWKKPIGCGSYRITEAVEGEYFLLEAYKQYFGKKPGIQKLRIRLNEEDCVGAMKSGELPFYVTNDPEEIAQLKGLEECSEHTPKILFPTYFILNLSDDEGTNPYLKDSRVRKALLLAIDRDTIVNALFPGSSVTDTLVPSWDSFYWQEAEKYTFDPEQAKALLDEAGYDYEMPLRLRYSVKGQSTQDLMEAIAVYWRAIGINVDLEKFEGSGSEHMFAIRDYDICYKRLSAFDHAAIYEEVHGDGVMQESILHQPVYDDLIESLEKTMGKEERAEIIQKMQMLDQQYLLRLPLFSLANIAYINDNHFYMPEEYGNLWYRYDLCFEQWELMHD